MGNEENRNKTGTNNETTRKEIQLFDQFIKTFLINKNSFIVNYKDGEKYVEFNKDDIDICLNAIKDITKMSDLKELLLEKKVDEQEKGKKKKNEYQLNQKHKKNYILLWHCYYIMYIMYKTSKTFLCDDIEVFKAMEKTEGDKGIDLFLDDNERVASTKQVYSSEGIRPFRVLLTLFKEIWNCDNLEEIKEQIKTKVNSWCNKNDDQDNRVKNILLYLCDPENYMPIISQSHKDAIAKNLDFLLEPKSSNEDSDNNSQNSNETESNPKSEIVKQIAQIIKHILQGKAADENLYSPNIRCFWDSQLINTNSDKEDNLDVETLLRFKKAVVLYGPPGTSKTYSARELAKSIICKKFAEQLKNKKDKTDKKKRFIDFIKNEETIFDEHIHKLQLHANYTYEDFIAGKTIKNNNVITQKGYILNLIDRIEKDETDYRFLPHIVILDEINRVDISRIFGELFTAMEPDYRKKGLDLPLKYKGAPLDLWVPENLYFIGTMNLIDFSLEQVDFALRRRFAWVKNTFDKNRLQAIIEDKLNKAPNIFGSQNLIDEYVSSCEALNKVISKGPGLGEQFWIGHTFFAEIVDILKETDIKDLAKAKVFLWRISLKPMLEAYCGTMDDETKKSFIKECKEAFMPQDSKE